MRNFKQAQLDRLFFSENVARGEEGEEGVPYIAAGATECYFGGSCRLACHSFWSQIMRTREIGRIGRLEHTAGTAVANGNQEEARAKKMYET
mmetsp:Transcript_30360/g.64283  ORF Transcript_30360/g.64283 Transcript_30360/m.64283 type:complete len:92 (+) Transcript_30360:1130-1405(+)